MRKIKERDQSRIYSSTTTIRTYALGKLSRSELSISLVSCCHLCWWTLPDARPDSPDEVLLSKSGIWCKPDEILQTIQTEYANNLEKIASNIKPGNLQTRLESFASKARSVNKAGFIKGYTTGWAQAVTQAATEATTRKEKREKILEEIEKDGFPDETAGFEDGLMEKA